MKRSRVLVATTEGPSEIQQITAEDPEVRSVICLDGTSEALPISADYESFVRKPTGVVERLYGHSSYRTDVSHPISGGRSWQLGLLLAHDLFAAGRLATKGLAADQVLWATGEVRHNLDVVGVDYVREKLRESAGQLRAAAAGGAGITLLIPLANRADIEAEMRDLGLGDEVRVEALQRWQSGVRGGVGRARARGRAVAVTALAIAAVAYGAWTWLPANTAAGLDRLFGATNPPAPATVASAASQHPDPAVDRLPPPPRPAPVASSPRSSAKPSPQSALGVDVFAVELRPPAGHTCGGQRLTGGGLTETMVGRDASGEFPHRAARDLCDVEFRVRNTGNAARHVWIHVHPTLEGTRPRTGEATIEPGKELSLRVGASPWEAGTPWNATIVVAVDPKTAVGNADQRGVQQVTAALRAANVPYETVIYTAEASPRPYR